MQGWHRSRLKGRVAAAALALGAHVLLAMLLLVEFRFTPRVPAPSRELIAIAIHLPPLTAPVVEPKSSEATSTVRSIPRAITPDVVPIIAPTPQTAITLPPANEPPPRGVDWRAQAAALAARHREPESNATFSPPPERMREPCEQRNYRNRTSSFKWKADDMSKGGSAILTPDWEPPPVYDGLFDDMKAGRTPDSSVPDKKACD